MEKSRKDYRAVRGMDKLLYLKCVGYIHFILEYKANGHKIRRGIINAVLIWKERE
jgi:hypothetical protein